MARTKIVRLTATRCFLGQATIEIPDYAFNDRIRGIICSGGHLARLLAAGMSFDRIQGTGLANCYLANADKGTRADFQLTDIQHALRADGFIF